MDIMSTGSGGFDDLLQQAEQLTAEMDSGSDLPRVDRNLPQILEAGQRLWARTAQLSQDSAQVKASILLGSQGYDVPQISQKLEELSTAKTFEPLEPIGETDIQGFLKNERENALLAVIEQTRKQTIELTDRHHWEALENEWDREKQKILNALMGSNQDLLETTQDSQSILEDSSISLKGRSALDNVEMAYSSQVYVYNERIINGGLRPSLVEMFAEVAKTLDDKNLIDLWDMMKYMVEVPTVQGSSPAVRTSQKMQHAFVKQALRYLQDHYRNYITTTIYENLQQAELGGIPGTIQLVRSFLNVKQVKIAGLEDGVVDGQPLWAMIYYCLRCGDLKAAQTIIDKHGHRVGEFASFLYEYVNSGDNRLNPSSETKIRLQYRRVIKSSTDPYKRAVYCIIGQCDHTDDHNEIADKIEDYLWLKLTQIRIDGVEGSSSRDSGQGHDQLTLQQLQTLLYQDYGESHFNAYQQPYLYVQVLLLSAQFESAIEFLSRIDALRCHATHMALALYELRLLLIPPSIHAQMSTYITLPMSNAKGSRYRVTGGKTVTRDNLTEGPVYRLNLARLVTLYTRKFEATDPREALQYFYFLRDLRTSQGDNLFMSCVSEMVQETREFELLLGRVERDGTRRPGAIDKFHGDTQRIIELVARDTEQKGLFEDSVNLYDLAGKHEKVLELLINMIGQVVSQPSTGHATRERIKTTAVSVAERYGSQSNTGGQVVASTFYLLLDLLTFFDLYHTTSYDEALEVMHALKLLPLTTDMVEQKISDFRHYADEVRRCLPDILLATMNILHQKYKNSRTALSQSPMSSSSSVGDGGKETFQNYMRTQARALIMFAGMLPYRMPGDTNARLVQMEVLMN